MLTFEIFDGEYATPEYSSLEISPLINGAPLADILQALVKKERAVCHEHLHGLTSYIPYYDIADYMKDERSHRKLMFFCPTHPEKCGCDCEFSACLRKKGGAIIMDRFVQSCYGHAGKRAADYALDMRKFAFDENEYRAELERVKKAFDSKERTNMLLLPTAQMKAYRDGEETSFYVRGARKRTWIHPGSDESGKHEASADGCLDIIIPLEGMAPGDKILVRFDDIDWEYSTSDDETIVYGGHNKGYYYGVCVPDNDSLDRSNGNALSSFIVETMLLKDCPDRYLFRDIQFEIVKRKGSEKSDFIVLTVAWCSEEQENAEEIAINATW